MRLISLLALAGLLVSAPVSAQTLETRVTGLEYPWSLAFLPDGRMLVTEKPGRLRIIDESGLVQTPVSGVPEVFYSGQGGLLDVVLSLDFETDGLVYLSWSGGRAGDNTLYLGRGRLEGDALVEFDVLFEAMPHRRTDVHYGGRMAMIPAEAGQAATVVMGVGDGFDYREEAQNPGTHFGTYVRLGLDGQPAQRVFENSAPGVISIGHRNPQAVVYDATNHVVWSHEHGPRGGDEINELSSTANYGWPITSHGVDYTGALVTPFDTYAGIDEPIHVWTPSIAPAGMALYRGEMFPEWDGDLLVAALIPGDADVPSGHVRRVELDAGQVVGEEVLFGEIGARIRDVRVGPDGAVWLLTDEAEGRLIRVSRD